MRIWLKAMITVLGIVLGGFSIAAFVTLLNEKFSVNRVLSNADSSQELLPLSQTIINNSNIGLRVVQISFEQAPELVPSFTQESSYKHYLLNHRHLANFQSKTDLLLTYFISMV